MFVSVVHPVAILSAVFRVICSLLMFVSDASGDHMVETYSSMGLVMALYAAMIVSFCFPHVVDVSALSICIVFRAFVVEISMCLVYVSLGSRVSPRTLGLMFMGSVMLSICSSSCVLYSAWSGVKRVHVFLYGLRMRLYVFHVGMIGCLLLLCLRCLMLTLSGPVELLFLLCFIAAWTCVVVSVLLVVCSLSVFLYMCLFVLCMTVLVNCLLNAFAICVGEVNVFF